VQAICDFVHAKIRFSYPDARPTRSASDSMYEGIGVCRDFAHLAITLCRCMNIPARFCAGYLGNIGVPVDPNPMDFSGWAEVFLAGRWYTIDARHNHPRIGRIVTGRGRDAADVAISTENKIREPKPQEFGGRIEFRDGSRRLRRRADRIAIFAFGAREDLGKRNRGVETKAQRRALKPFE
jgi:hypothetical protein